MKPNYCASSTFTMSTHIAKGAPKKSIKPYLPSTSYIYDVVKPTKNVVGTKNVAFQQKFPIINSF